eukprot:TRINITY_DN11995_c0_g2_i1.p3 TRINITY_DN11995_c0_g2~~TRINITY_DN11995_c0_g2_i1.p3  ORF type:complete len:204 (-),score=44.84 TRINITY_DN11995_c0_g2_i1:66-677(-)
MLFCFVETFDLTFKNDGGVGSFFEGVKQQDPNNYDYERFFFDNIENYLIVIIMINIVAGIIIDEFGNLRVLENNKNSDIQDICFICGHQRETFDKKADSQGGFASHIKEDHYMWNYLFYIAYLREKEKTEYTGIESYIDEKLAEFDHSWFPFQRAISLKDSQEDEEKQYRNKLLQVEEKLNFTKKLFQELVQKGNTLNKQLQS